jgi:hypothetical protein
LPDGQFIADLPAGYEPPGIRVTTDPQTAFKPIGRSRGPDLLKILDDAHDLAATGEAQVPPGVPPVPVDRTTQRQFSFSRLTGQLVRTRKPNPPSALLIDETDTIDPRGLGTLVHDVLSRIQFGQTDDIAAWCEHLAPYHVIQNATPASRSACEMIQRFVASPRGSELASATTLYREVDFLLAWPPDQNNDDGNYVQGVIDCLYQDSKGVWHVADFKTNDAPAAEVPRVAKQYELQLYVYAMAAERTLGKPPQELVLHFLRPGAEHVFPWNDAARQKATRMLNQAIADSLASDSAALNPQPSTLNAQPC